jgi:hypothetical protein
VRRVLLWAVGAALLTACAGGQGGEQVVFATQDGALTQEASPTGQIINLGAGAAA